jgi:hypothetical protein
MKRVFKNRVGSFIIYFALASPFFSNYALFAIRTELGNGSELDHYNFVFSFLLANWPSLLLKIYPMVPYNNYYIYNIEKGFIHPGVILINAIGWGMVGGLFGLLWAGVGKMRKKKRK